MQSREYSYIFKKNLDLLTVQNTKKIIKIISHSLYNYQFDTYFREDLSRADSENPLKMASHAIAEEVFLSGPK